jgi:hypothetical protein
MGREAANSAVEAQCAALVTAAATPRAEWTI